MDLSKHSTKTIRELKVYIEEDIETASFDEPLARCHKDDELVEALKDVLAEVELELNNPARGVS